MVAPSTSIQLGHVLLGSTPSQTSTYARATGLTYDIRTDVYGRDRTRSGSITSM